MAEGKTNKEIAKELWLAKSTVENHVQSIYYKLGVNDRTNAVIYYFKNLMPVEPVYRFIDWRDQHSEQLAELFQEGRNVTEISKIMDLPTPVIRQKLDSLGLIL